MVIGLIMVNLLQPGEGVEGGDFSVPEKVSEKESVGFTSILRTFISPNLIHSMAEMEILPLIVFSLIFGGVLTTLGERGKLVIDFFDVVNTVIMKIVHLVMLFAPIGVFGLIASKLGATGGGDAFM